MLVKDIYGEKSPYSDLIGELLASSFAKVATDQPSDSPSKDQLNLDQKYKQEDILNSLVTMISFNIG